MVDERGNRRRALALIIGLVACADTPQESVLIDDSGPSTGACVGAGCTTTGDVPTSTTDDSGGTSTTQASVDSSGGPATDGTGSTGGTSSSGSEGTGVATSSGSSEGTSSSTGAASSDGTSTGGSSTGDASTGGTSTGDASTGYASTGYASTGYASTGDASSGSSSGSSTGGVVDIASLSDEFDDAASLSDWSRLDQVLGIEAPYDILDVDLTAPGQLAITPRVSVWYMDEMATLIYKEVTGDFLVEVDVGAYMLDTYNPPNALYNSAGVMIRDPASAEGEQNWVEYNIGYQLDFVGLEGKATLASVSELVLVETEGSRARLRMCRLGDEVHMLVRAPGDVAWTETHTYPDTFVATPGLALPETVQVGMVANAYVVADVHAEFEYIRLREVSDVADCTAD